MKSRYGLLPAALLCFASASGQTISTQAPGGEWNAVGPEFFDCGGRDFELLPDGRLLFINANCGGIDVSESPLVIYDPELGVFSPLSPATPGSGGTIQEVAVSPSGVIYAAGQFSSLGGVPVNNIARFENGEWLPLGAGIEYDLNGSDALLADLATVGEDLYVGGDLAFAGGLPVNAMARWDGSTWDDVGGGVDGYVLDFSVRGTSLVVGGLFSSAGAIAADNVATWNQSEWSALTTANNFSVSVPAVTALYAEPGGIVLGADADGVLGTNSAGFEVDGVAGAVAYWDGTWSILDGTAPAPASIDGNVCDDFGSFFPTVLEIDAITRFQGGIVVSGCFGLGEVGTRVALWNGSNWQPLLGGGSDLPSRIRMVSDQQDLWVVSSGAGAGGNLESDRFTGRALRLSGGEWEVLKSRDPVKGIQLNRPEIGDVGARLHAVWNGRVISSASIAGRKRLNPGAWDIASEQWISLGEIPAFPETDYSAVNSAHVSDGGDLYLATTRQDPVTGQQVFELTRWQSLDSRSTIGTFDQPVNAIATLDGSVFVGGSFGVKLWDGLDWIDTGVFRDASLGNDSAGFVTSLAVLDGELHAGGRFTSIDENPVSNIARWTGVEWAPLGGDPINGTDFNVNVLEVFDGSLYAAGNFLEVGGGVSSPQIARWDGLSWFEVGRDGIDQIDFITSLQALDGNLYAGGQFQFPGIPTERRVARWDGQRWDTAAFGADAFDGHGNLTHVEAIESDGRALFFGGYFKSAGGSRSEQFAIFTPSKVIAAAPECVVFPDTVVDTTSQPMPVSIENVGISQVQVQAAGIIGAHASEFSFQPSTDDCIDNTLRASDTCSFSVAFTPSSSGIRTAALTITSDASAPEKVIELIGTSGVPYFDGFEASRCTGLQ